MPIYEPKDYDMVIKRIQEKIDILHIKMGKCLSEEEIVAFEDCNKIQLPQAYRMFLKKVGDGCERMIDKCCLNSLENSPCQNLSKPFMLEKFWIWEDDDRDSGMIESDLENKVYRGNIELIKLGDCISFNLIITGKCRGEVWNFSDVGVQPCSERQDFLGWFELWVDNQDETDYFKDYMYDETDDE